jgi:hypothetical protein
MDIKKLKLLLRDKYRVLVLDDMTGPVDINGSLLITAQSRLLHEDDDEDTLAAALGEQAKRTAEGAKLSGPAAFAFYKFDTNSAGFATIRYAMTSLPWYAEKTVPVAEAV